MTTTLSPRLAFTGAGIAFASLYLAAGAPTPLLVLFERQWGFAPWVLTIAFAAYAIGLLAALLVVGSLSDHVGRRPVLVGALTVELVAMLMFVFAPNIGWVIAARVVQGIATGAASSAFTAALVELAPPEHKRLGAIVGAVAPAGGLGLGALLTGVAVQFTHEANRIVFVTLAVLIFLGTVAAAASAETATRQSGALASLRPRVTIPPGARREFAAAAPVHLASWMFAGLFMGLSPSIIRDLFGIDSGLLNGATAFVPPTAAAVAGFVLGRHAPRRVIVLGAAAVLTGAAIVVAGLAGHVLALLWVGGLIGGAGFGASFSGALRAVGPLAEAHQRAGLFAAVFLAAYLSFGVPAIVAGQLVAPLGLLRTTLWYGLAIVLAAAAGLAAQWRITLRSAG
ncbi:MFS transporter [Dactylosporangium sp. AC04546]|uniref:MFS transporter n=1 Tax=Dactylosporangium sp. AC04546 TaxID=2862460 RepID=UPI001EE153D9|nr:MFS transporter [Dactylosporangium sp. AC04546]WVK87653.1 MFS transporter [Dactylosporangium sp. AC04546]